MPWNAVWPDGTKSVKANTTPGQQNTTYIKTTLNVDHFWDNGTNLDGRHMQVQMPKLAAGLTLGTSMDGGFWINQVSGSVSDIQGFYKNAVGTYQFIPSFRSGTVNVTGSTYQTVISVPNNVYGQIMLWLDFQNITYGYFLSNHNVVNAFSIYGASANTDEYTALRLLNNANGSDVTDLNIKARVGDGAAGTYNFRIIYWGV